MVRYQLTTVGKIWKYKETAKKCHSFYIALQNLSIPVLILMHGSRSNLINISMGMNFCNLTFTSVDSFWWHIPQNEAAPELEGDGTVCAVNTLIV